MKIIRNETVQGVVRCLPGGEVTGAREISEGFHELLNLERAKAFAMGKEEGEKSGYRKAKEEIQTLFHLLQAISDKMLEQKKELFSHMRIEVIELVIAIAERVIRLELSQPEKMAKLIESFLDHTAFQGEIVKIFLAPEDMSMMEAALHKLEYDRSEIKGVRFESDVLQRQGDVRIETKASMMNFQLMRELEDVRQKVARM